MPACPTCGKPLETIPQREGVFYSCLHCGGRALSVPQVRRIAGDNFAVKLLRLLRLNRGRSNHACPFCSQQMVGLSIQDPALELEGCRPCNVIWFEARQYEVVPEGAAESTSTLPSQAIEIHALNRLKELKERQEREEAERKRKKQNSLRQSLRDLWNQDGKH